MIPNRIMFGCWNGKDGKTPPFLAIPACENGKIIFENPEDVDDFIDAVETFRDNAFGNA